MDQRLKVVFVGMCTLLCFLCLSKAASGQALPDGKGKAEFVHNCTACHRADMSTRLRKTPDEWRKTVDNMAARGTDGSKEDLDNVVLYLSTNFGADKPGPDAVPPSTTPPSTPVGPTALTSVEIERVKRIIAESNCLTCRRVETPGAHTVALLNGADNRSKANRIETAVVRPRPMLGAETTSGPATRSR